MNARKDKILEKGYTTKFYDEIKLNRSSAQIIVPIILDLVKAVYPNEVIDVVDFGCGTAQWLAEYKACGCEVTGIDGDRV